MGNRPYIIIRNHYYFLIMKTTIKIFLASSDELSEERTEVELFIARENDELFKKGIRFKLIIWERLPHSFQKERKQDDFNKEMLKCDIVLALFFKKVGQFTKEEFELAYQNLKEGKKPHHLFVYFRSSDIPSNEITRDYMKIIELKEDIKEHEQYPGSYDSTDNLIRKLKGQLDLIISDIKGLTTPLPKSDRGQDIPSTTPVIPDVYKDWIIDHCQYMGVDKLREKGNVIQVKLPEIFIPLYAYPPKIKEDGVGPVSQTGQKTKDINLLSRMDHEPGEKETTVDIETLVGESKYLLIEGEPGSGKTTLLKHISYCLMQNLEVKRLGGFLPILIFVKDLKDFFKGDKRIKPNSKAAETILSSYFDETENGLDIDTVMSFCKAEKAIFLLDGLDEINTESRDIIVKSFADFRSKHKKNKFVLSGRPHGMEGAVVDRFGDRHVRIQTLNMEQIQEFIKRWFRYIYHQGSKFGMRTAADMISEVKIHPGIGSLVDNPLMLTAICILYHDGKELPGQRAELYKKFIENLLYKRFDDHEKVYEFLNTLAFKMHTKRVRSVDRSFATDILKSVYVNKGMEDREYTKWIENLFDLIEPNCGLIKLDDGQYNFWHLTFQEFLTAVYIIDNNTEYEKAINKYWGNPWYNEVIELYVSYLSIENRKWANQIVEKTLNVKDKDPFHKWLLASKSMVDMHKDRRDTEVLEKSKKVLLKIIDVKPKPEIFIEAGETLGWLGDPRNLKGFVIIPGGKYKLERGPVDIKPFEICKYPVTNRWFKEFINANGYKKEGYWSKEGMKWLEYINAEQPARWNDRKWKCPNSPVVGVSWYEAYAFTKWLSTVDNNGYEYRLLEENEWEAAAAGLEGREYPWDNKWDKNKCNNSEIKLGKTSPVGIFKEGNTPDNISDLSGNVWEWTTSDYHSKNTLNDFTFDDDMQKLLDEEKINDYVKKLNEKNRELPVLRGGSWGGDSDGCRCAYRNYNEPGIRDYYIGFRCARTLTL